MQSSTSAVDTPTADPTQDIDMDNTVDFPFCLSPEQVSTLVSLSPEQWLQHCQNVQANHPWTQPEVDRFLSLPIEKIVEVFRATVHNLSTSTPPPPTTRTTSTPTSPALDRLTATPTPLPKCPFTLSRTDRKKALAYSEEEWLEYANHLKSTKGSSPNMKAFLLLPPETIIASIKASFVQD